MPTITEILDKALAAGTPQALAEAASDALVDTGIKPGAKVAVLDDPIYGMNGLTGTVKGPSDKSGFVDVMFANKMVVPLQSTLLATL